MRPSPWAVGLARELYDRFVMGGWEPQDTYDLIDDVLEAYKSVQTAREAKNNNQVNDLDTDDR